MEINEYFNYWDEFFKVWKNSKNQSDYENGVKKLKAGFEESPFNYPKGIMNCDCKSNETFEYIPEPYWGWTPKLKTELKFVVVNYNPASGGEQQHRSSSNIAAIEKYSDYVSEQITKYLDFKKNSKSQKPNQYETTNWHFNNRANKLAQLNSELVSKDNSSIKNYLGIDLVPWHTKNVSALNGYLESNFPSIQKWSLDFAIEASKKVTSELKNKVIVRTNLTTFNDLFRNEFDKKIFTLGDCKKETQKNNNDNFQQIQIKGSEVSIILLWGMRNSLPTKEFMKQILKEK